MSTSLLVPLTLRSVSWTQRPPGSACISPSCTWLGQVVMIESSGNHRSYLYFLSLWDHSSLLPKAPIHENNIIKIVYQNESPVSLLPGNITKYNEIFRLFLWSSYKLHYFLNNDFFPHTKKPKHKTNPKAWKTKDFIIFSHKNYCTERCSRQNIKFRESPRKTTSLF